MPYTNGFANPALLSDHFTKHKNDFGCTTEQDYETMADEFCGGVMDTNTQEYIRSYDGAVIRYNSITNEFGVVGNDDIIKTYFKPSQGMRYFQRKCV